MKDKVLEVPNPSTIAIVKRQVILKSIASRKLEDLKEMEVEMIMEKLELQMMCLIRCPKLQNLLKIFGLMTVAQ